jgi:SulP family sulfate permease
VPTSVSYANIIGVSPLVGIWTSAIVGFCVTLVGGGPGLIAGAAGVIALPMAKLLALQGNSYMLGAVILSGLFEVVFGMSRLSRFSDIVEEPVIAGFLNAFAFFLVKTQIKTFQAAGGGWLQGSALLFAGGITALCAAIIRFLPVLFKKSKIPASLVGVVGSTLFAVGLKVPTKSLADTVGKTLFTGGIAALPTWCGVPSIPCNMQTLRIIFSTAVGAAIIGILETVLAGKISCDSYRCLAGNLGDDYEGDDYDRVVIGLGLGNIISALFGGFGGCGLIPNTLLNGSSGGLGYASGFAYSLFLGLFVVVFSPLIGVVPVASLAGLMLTVAFNTFEWAETGTLIAEVGQSPQKFLDCFAMILTTVLCFKVDMGLGVLVGVFVNKFLPILGSGKRMLDKVLNPPNKVTKLTYDI